MPSKGNPEMHNNPMQAPTNTEAPAKQSANATPGKTGANSNPQTHTKK